MSGRRYLPSRWISRRAAGRIMIGVAVVGLVTALLGTLVAWQLVGQLGRSTDQSLALGEEALASLGDTLDVAEQVVVAVDEGLGGVGTTLSTVAEVVDGTSAVAATSSELAADLAPSLERVDDALASLESLTGTIDGALRQLSRIPFGPTYDPETSFDEAIGAVRDDLNPIAERLRTASVELAGFAGGSSELQADLDALVDDVERVRASLAGSSQLIDSYRRTAEDAAFLAAGTRDDLGADLARSRILIVILGLTFAVGQIVPAWTGRELLLGAVDPPNAPGG